MKIIKSCNVLFILLVELKNNDLGVPVKLVWFLFSAVLPVGLIESTVTLGI